jgi:hypothetical protein
MSSSWSLTEKHLPVQLMRRDEHERRLYAPIDEVRDHALRRDASGRTKMIWQGRKARPDGFDHLGHALCSVGCLDAEPVNKSETNSLSPLSILGGYSLPEERKNATRHYAEVREPVAVRSSDRYWKCNVQVCSYRSVEYGRYGIAKCSDQSDQDSIRTCQTKFDD